MNRFYFNTLCTVTILLLAAGCSQDENNLEDEERVRMIPVETVTITPDTFDDFFRVTGVVEAIHDATISSESSGRIQSILERGAVVEQGGIIARMDDRLNRAQYEAAKTSFELAEDTYTRLRALYEDEVISTQDYRSARAQKEQARAQLDQAEKQLRDAHIEAPFSGRVEERFVRSGELINPGMPVVRLVNSDTVRITAGIPERFSGQVTEGTPVQVRFRSYDNMRFESRVTFAGNLIDGATRTFPIEVELRNEVGSIKPEMVADLHVKRRTIENAIIIPRTAIVRDESGPQVFVARERDGNKIAELVPVQTGAASGPVIEVLDGLEEGDEVVIAGMSALSIGDRLNVVESRNSHEKARELQQASRPVPAN